MNSFILYIFQVSLVFGSFYLFYKLVISRFSFHSLNRSFLVAIIPLSILLPLHQKLFPEVAYFNFEIPLLETLPTFTDEISETDNMLIATENSWHWSFWVLIVYIFGVFLCVIRISNGYRKLIRVKANAQKVILQQTAVYKADVAAVFSYFHWIFIPKSSNFVLNEMILIHEKAHVRKLHSWDVLLTELFTIFLWFHPLAYFHRKALKNIHEFQADAAVLRQNIKKSDYLCQLLHSLVPAQPNPNYNYFSHPSIKKRIEMITNAPSKNSCKLSYLLIIPLMFLLCTAFKTAAIDPFTHPELETVQTADDNDFIAPIQKKNIQRISAVFGIKRKHPKLKNTEAHGGIDIVAKLGTPVYAVSDGMVLKASNNGNWGNLIIIAHADGFETWYAHLQGFNTTEKSSVKKGEIIGYVGNTGLSTGAHLHYEVRQNGTRLNPMNYMPK